MAHLGGYFHISDRTVQGGHGLKVGATCSWWRWLFPPRPAFIDPGVTSQVRPNKPDEGTDVPSAASGSDMAVSLASNGPLHQLPQTPCVVIVTGAGAAGAGVYQALVWAHVRVLAVM